MPFTNAAKDAMMGAIAPTHVSLHSGAPGQTGASELSGGGYARAPASFAAAVNGVRALSADVTLTVPAGATVNHVGYWTALTGGTFLGFDDVTQEVFGSAGSYIVTAAGTTLAINDA